MCISGICICSPTLTVWSQITGPIGYSGITRPDPSDSALVETLVYGRLFIPFSSYAGWHLFRRHSPGGATRYWLTYASWHGYASKWGDCWSIWHRHRRPPYLYSHCLSWSTSVDEPTRACIEVSPAYCGHRRPVKVIKTALAACFVYWRRPLIKLDPIEGWSTASVVWQPIRVMSHVASTALVSISCLRQA